jgi:hypothetical protein
LVATPKKKKNDPKTNRGSSRRRAPLARVRQDGDSTGDPRTRLGNLFVYDMLVFCFFLYE